MRPKTSRRVICQYPALEEAEDTSFSIFCSATLQEHESKACVPEDTEFTPIAFFSPYREDSILQQIVHFTNIYAQIG